ncbi:MAG: hypothetical protein MZU79_02285 [Anaerotruncus sp.]|nr:hypothetical protein [Anaerotruncus sp.]
MTIAGYAIGAEQGILYLRGEYAYLRAVPRATCSPSAARPGCWARTSWASEGFDFDIRIQLGAGAYVCGEETGADQLLRGHARRPARPPAVPGRRRATSACPTVVNNVETLCCAARILEKGAGWFSADRHRGEPRAPSCSASPATARGPASTSCPSGITAARAARARWAPRTPWPCRSAARRAAASARADFEPHDLLRGPRHRRLDDGLRPEPRHARRRRATSWTSSSRRAAATARPAGWATCCSSERLERIRAGPRRSRATSTYLEELGATVKTHEPLRPRADRRPTRC